MFLGNTRCFQICYQLSVDGFFFIEAQLQTRLSQLLEALRRVEPHVLLQLLLADGAEDFDAAAPLLIRRPEAVHQALVVDAVAQAELMAELAADYVAGAHEDVLLPVRILDAVP